MRILVLGGQGNFGARICRALVRDPGHEVLAAGRTQRPAPAGCESVRFVQLDLDAADFPAALARIAPNIVVHCAGPFQGQDYRVARAAIAAGAHYVDLADSRPFAAQFAAAVDAEARAAGVMAICGASTLPALSAAVIDAMRPRFLQLREIMIVIAPAQRAQRGAATIAGVFSYAGRPFTQFAGGRWRKRHGWMGLDRVRLPELGTRWSAWCDVPDVELLPARYPGVQTVEFRAALEVGVQHIVLWAAACMRRLRIPLPLERWAAPLDRIASHLDVLGSERGGMLVRLQGSLLDGRRGQVEWYLVVDDNHGPEVPCIAALLVIARLADGRLARPGAMPCLDILKLADFGPEFARWKMRTRVEEWPH